MTRDGAVRGDGTVQRVRLGHVEWAGERMSERDWLIVEAVNRLRLLTGAQVERLFFNTLAGHSRAVTRGRVLRRLVSWRVLALLPRRVGGAARGSSGSVFALDSAGARLVSERQAATSEIPRVRHASVPTERTVRHILAISELYARLVEQSRTQGAQIVSFEAEPACWWPNGIGGYVKPDAYTLSASTNVREHWWIEADLATESLPTIRRKLLTYLNFVERGQLGPGKLIPRVLISTVTPERKQAIAELVKHLPEPASGLFVVVLDRDAAGYMLGSLEE